MSNYPERINISPTCQQKREDDFYLVDRDAFPGKGTEYIRADLAKPRVKPLVWVASELFKAFTSGHYVVQHEHDECGGVWVTGIDGEIIAECETLDSAKAAAQSDHEARVLACLEGYGDE